MGEAEIYRERSHLVAHLAAIYPAMIIPGADPEEPGWPVLFVGLPTGQVTWHIAPDDMDLFAHVERGAVGSVTWDGHDADEKYRRLDEQTRMLSDER